MQTNDIQPLIAVSRKYGADSRFVLLGGGNTSFKTDSVMYVKASGHALGNIGKDGFVAMDREKLNAIWEKQYAEDVDERERSVLADMMDARNPGETARPSVEALLHSFIPFAYVVHMHPAMVNGLTCAQSGKESMERLFPEALWIPLVNPGYILAKVVRDAQSVYIEKRGKAPQVIFLQNHGVFVSADTIEEIDSLYTHIMETLSRSIIRKPNFTKSRIDQDRVALVQQAMSAHFGGQQAYPMVANHELESRLVDRETFTSLASAYTPDHIVYSGFKPLWVELSVFDSERPVEEIIARFKRYESDYGVPAKVIAVQQTAGFATSESAMTLFIDTVKVAAFTESFGGPRFMDDDQIEFIRSWEVEQYRANVQR
jgi:rhamnose utilization protein RhaD (predicted bifunctional aldolase and dehydrogenase)